MYDLTQFNLQNVTDIGIALRGFGQEADTIETVAQRSVRYLYDNLIDPHTGQSACALVRFFKTHAYGKLPKELQIHAHKALEQADELSSAVKCLTLLATVGTQPNWNDRRTSQGHQVIPLTSAKGVQQIPMMAQLIRSFGLEINSVVAPDPKLLIELERKTYNVFFIPQAAGSKFIPGQTDFVNVYGIKSVLGFGGMLPSGNLFTIILFTKVPIPDATAQLFKALPLSIKMALLALDSDYLFYS
ncbi:MAG: hypothetical protein F6K11_02560 [Leptolyngbya sp. SIO3F4]|nr:hypothetical protein [Leptolyngbya sp. SIO3F4]